MLFYLYFNHQQDDLYQLIYMSLFSKFNNIKKKNVGLSNNCNVFKPILKNYIDYMKFISNHQFWSTICLLNIIDVFCTNYLFKTFLDSRKFHLFSKFDNTKDEMNYDRSKWIVHKLCTILVNIMLEALIRWKHVFCNKSIKVNYKGNIGNKRPEFKYSATIRASYGHYLFLLVHYLFVRKTIAIDHKTK